MMELIQASITPGYLSAGVRCGKGSPMTYLSQVDAALAAPHNRGAGYRREERVYQVVTVAAMVTMIASALIF